MEVRLREIYEIIDSEEISDYEVMFVVSQYIKDRKGVSVKVDLAANCPAINANLLRVHISRQLSKLFQAYKYASLWYIEKRNSQKEKL